MARTPRVPDGPAPAPAVQRLRVRYAKRGRMRFTSTRDFQRALERAVRRAGLPMAYSGGFHPHPKISYANAAPTGAASEAEYVELSLAHQVDTAGVRPILDAALPPGLDVVEVVDVTEAGAPLADELEASVWALRFRAQDAGPSRAELSAALLELMALEEFHVSRMMKQGARELDVRAAVLALELAAADAVPPQVPAAPGDLVVLAQLRHTTPTIRPAELWAALRAVSDLDLPQPVSTRLRQGPIRGSGVDEPGDRRGV